MAALCGGALVVGGCIGRGDGDSAGPAQNAGTAAAAARASDTPFTAGCGAAITPAAAAQRTNTSVTVVGAVVAGHYDVSTPGAPTYLELGSAYPDPASPSIVILNGSRSHFPADPETLYQGKTICVVGVVTDYVRRKAIFVGTAEGITVVG